MGLSRKDLLKRIRYNKRVNYDITPSRAEMIEPTNRPERMFRPVKSLVPRSSMPQESGKSPGLTPTQDALINQIPQKYNQPRHAVRSFMVDYLASREPGGLVHHLGKHFNYPVPEGMSFDTSKMGAQQAQEHAKKTYGYISGLEHYLHKQGNKNYGHDIMKAMGDYLDKTQRSDKVLNQMHQHFSKS